jgi:hypothetical protein
VATSGFADLRFGGCQAGFHSSPIGTETIGFAYQVLQIAPNRCERQGYL